MIDADQLERDIDAAPPGSIIGFTDGEVRDLIAELRRGYAAIRALPKVAGAATVTIATAAMRVPDGYRASDRPIGA